MRGPSQTVDGLAPSCQEKSSDKVHSPCHSAFGAGTVASAWGGWAPAAQASHGGACLGGLSWLAPEAVTLVREALRGALDGLARRPPVVGTLAAGRAADALAVLPKEG
jgi:hypothetical protein